MKTKHGCFILNANIYPIFIPCQNILMYYDTLPLSSIPIKLIKILFKNLNKTDLKLLISVYGLLEMMLITTTEIHNEIHNAQNFHYRRL